ncbi:tetratricopeptide repeat protein [bacterium]|nr:tetratricopeptide repeat protein [bacterium]
MIRKLLILFFICFINISTVFAITTPQKYQSLEDFNKSMEKFKSSNVSIAYTEFEKIVEESPSDNDYINIVLSGKLSDIGFYNLANKARLKIKDKDLSQVPLQNIDIIFYQNKKLDIDDEIYLGECFSDITYNNLSKETAADLTANTDLLEKYDYALYLAALAWYKNNNLAMADKYLTEALVKNPKNVMYKYLQAKILADKGFRDKAFKTAESIKKDVILTDYYEKKYKEVEEYILYKTSKEDYIKNYHLAYYYYYRGDYLRSLKVMPQANIKNKKENSKIYALISRNYVALKEYEKAFQNAQKAHTLNKKNTDALILLGDLEFQTKNYKSALKYYKTAMKYEKSSYNASIRTAKTYLELDKKAKAQSLLQNTLKNSQNNYEAYYLEAVIDKNNTLEYLKKALSLNSEFVDAWLELAKYEIEKTDYKKAQMYLNNAYNLDETDYKYYYYQGLLYKNKKDIENANYNFQKSKTLSSKYIAIKKD